MPKHLRAFSLAGALILAACLPACKLQDKERAAATDPGPAPRASSPPAGASSATPAAKAKPKTEQEQRIEDYTKLGYRLEWVGYATIMTGQTVKHAQLLGDLLAVQDSAGALSAIQTRDGALRWSQAVGDELTNFVGLARTGRAIVASAESAVYTLDDGTGSLLSRQRLARIVTTAPAQFGDAFVFGTSGGAVIAHQASTGYALWAYRIGGPVERPPVAIGGDTVGVVSATGQVLMLDVLSGGQVGRTQMFAGASTAPVADEQSLYVASLDQSLYAFERTGVTRWRIRTEQPLTSQPTLHEGTLYLRMPDGFQAIDTRTGKARWTNKDAQGTFVAARNRRAIIWDGAVATTLDLATGDTVDQVRLPGVAALRADKPTDGNLYLVTAGGEVSKLAPK